MNTTPAFKRIGTTFQIGKQKYYGMAIASPEALYLIMAQARNDATMALAGGLGGAVGGLIAGAIAAAGARKAQPVRTCTLAELDPAVRDHPDWPFRAKRKDGPKQVLVVPRDEVDVLEHPSFTNLLKFKLGETAITIEYLLFRGGGVRDYLLAGAWPLRWRGRMLTHGQV